MDPDPGWTPPAPPYAARPSVRWGLPDALFCWITGLVAASVAVGVVLAATGATATGDDPALLLAAFVGQYGGMAAALFAISRAKGRGRLGLDFGLRVDLRRDWSMLLVGLGLQLGLGLALRPIAEAAGGGEKSQEVVRQIRESGGIELALLAVAAAVVAPVLEEVLFRGLLLRALLRRLPPAPAVAVSALTFGLVHLTDWGVGTAVVFPGLVAVGVLAGVLAVRSGNLSRPILLHAGFNLLVVVAALGS